MTCRWLIAVLLASQALAGDDEGAIAGVVQDAISHVPVRKARAR
ncbi:MAG: hypothetical protein NTY38_14675 [Acidobacteria bacterium]|nr:hypothetical protein [Acidobacteriota bacterium]